MEFCAKHWDGLRQAVDEQGLSHLVSANPVVAVVRGMAEASDDPEMFDPLMFAMWNLLSNGSKIINRPLLLIDGCPICYLLDEHERTCDGDPRCRTVEEVESWTGKAAMSARQRYETIR